MFGYEFPDFFNLIFSHFSIEYFYENQNLIKNIEGRVSKVEMELIVRRIKENNSRDTVSLTENNQKKKPRDTVSLTKNN